MTAPTVVLSPQGKQQFFYSPGVGLPVIPMAGGFLWTYAAGTTNKLNTYADATGNTPNTNPIVLNADGQCEAWINETLKYKYTLALPTDIDPNTGLPNDPPTNPVWTVDGIGFNDSIEIDELKVSSVFDVTYPLIVATILGSAYQWLQFAIGDQSSAITTGAAKFTTRFPACTILEARASLQTASSSGLPTFNIKSNGVTIFSTKITIDANELTSTTAATPPMISAPVVANDAGITFDIDVAGTGAKGPIISLKVKWS